MVSWGLSTDNFSSTPQFVAQIQFEIDSHSGLSGTVVTLPGVLSLTVGRT